MDRYTFEARLAPTLLVFLPLGLTIFAWFPENLPGWGLLSGALVSTGLAILLAQVGRDLGKRKEPSLFRKWCGIPTTVMLRHRDSKLDALTLARYHDKLGSLLKIVLPTPETERADIFAADKIYESCGRYLRERTRDRRTFPLIFAENVNYGFRRNLWGMKAVGTILSFSATVACALKVLFEWQQSNDVPALAFVATVANASLFSWWVLRITPSWVRVVADAYAERLLGACDQL